MLLIASSLAATACGAETRREEAGSGAPAAGQGQAVESSAAPEPAPAPDVRPGSLQASARRSTTAGAPPGSADTVVSGQVSAVGAAPLSQIVVRAGTAGPGVAVRGPRRAELARLVGAEVRVWGPAGANQPPVPPRAIEVRGYEILSIGGARPVVGTLLVRNGEIWLAGRDTLRVSDAPIELRAHEGATVWIVGLVEGGTLRLELYGILREPGG